MKKKVFLALIAITFTLVGYSRLSFSKSSLFQNKWQLQQINGKDSSLKVSTKAFIQFDNMQNRVSGNGSCNVFGGSLSITDNAISMQQLFSTKMYCENVKSIEDLFLESLSRVNSYTIKDNILYLSADDEVLLIFSAATKQEGAI